MKKLYYFSKHKLSYVEIKNSKRKIIAFLGSVIIIFLLISAAGYFVVSSIVDNSNSFTGLKKENKELKEKLREISSLYSSLSNELDRLIDINRDLRVAANLPPVSDEERKLGVGGRYFDNSFDFSVNSLNQNLKSIFNNIEEVKRKLDFEKANYSAISDKILQNKVLFQAIPAIKPCVGTISDGFGYRVHPILHVSRMHDGIDIITDVGTPVVSSGKGVVEYIGNKGGYGLAVEIDHGFGYKTVYAHLSSVEVRVGQKISRGDLIAKTGNTGLSTGPHLHYEILYDGIKQNPMDFLFDDVDLFNSEKK